MSAAAKESNHTFDFLCPFCGGHVSVGAPPDGVPWIIHAVPTCGRFDALEPDEFMAAVNDRFMIDSLNRPKRRD